MTTKMLHRILWGEYTSKEIRRKDILYSTVESILLYGGET